MAVQPNSTQVTVRVPVWLVAVVIVLLILVIVLSGMIIQMKVEQARSGKRDAAIMALEAQARETDDPRVLLELGFEYRKAGLLDEALRANKRVIGLDPKNVAARYHVGTILLEMGEFKQAEASFWDALEIDPTHAMSAKALGELYASRAQYKSLLVAVAPAAEANPGLADLQYLLGLGRERTGDVDGAAQAYWNAIERDPGLAEAREGLKRVGGGDLK